MSFLISILGLFATVWEWISGNKDKQLGKYEQENEDAQRAIEVQQKELQAVINRPDDKQLSDSLQRGEF